MEEIMKTDKRTKSNVPGKEADLNTVAADVAVSWEQRKQLTLVWTDAAQLKQSATTFSEAYTGRNDMKGSRRGATQEMKSINAEIDASATHVKGYLGEVYSKKEAPMHYESVGIVKRGKTYQFPLDNDKRLYALDQMLNGIAQHGLTDRKYGKQYWTAIRERFAQAKTRAAESDKASAGHVSNKATQKTLIRKILNALVHLIKANYPDTWKEELRTWGFQKEKY